MNITSEEQTQNEKEKEVRLRTIREEGAALSSFAVFQLLTFKDDCELQKNGRWVLMGIKAEGTDFAIQIKKIED